MRCLGGSVLLLILAAACAQTPSPSSPRPPAQAQSPDVLFHIRLARSQPPIDLSGVEVSLVAGDGRIVPVGKSLDGRVRVPKEQIRKLQATIILFCSAYTFCGAVSVVQGGVSILDFDEYYLELAPMVLV